jgi:hypothetical protein
MAFTDEFVKNGAAKGLIIGIGVAVLAPVLLPTLARVGRPVVRAMIKGGMVAYEKGRETAAELGEVVEDLVAEARAEMGQAPAESVSAPPAAQPSAADVKPGE